MTHTPGKWRSAGNYVYAHDGVGLPVMIARCPDVEGTDYLDNATLIAAAPEMLEQYEWMLRVIGDALDRGIRLSYLTLEGYKEAHAIFTKARGKEAS